MVVHDRTKTLKIQVFWGSPSPQGSYSPYILWDTTRPGHVTCPSLIQIGSKTAEKNSAQTNRHTDRHYENNVHFAVNKKMCLYTQWINCLHPLRFVLVCLKIKTNSSVITSMN